MNALPVAEAAAAMRVRPGTLRRWLKQGAPFVQRGRRGRGHALMVDVEQVLRWRGATAADAQLLELAAALPEVLAVAAFEAFRLTEGSHKRAAAGLLAAAWYLAASATLDHLRERCAAVPEITSVPEPIERLRRISKITIDF